MQNGRPALGLMGVVAIALASARAAPRRSDERQRPFVWALAVVLVASTTAAGCIDAIGGEDLDVQSIDAARPPRASGRDVAFDLYLAQSAQEIEPGVSVMVWAFSLFPEGPFTVPGPTLRVGEGDRVQVTFHNQQSMIHTIHWHGLHVPWNMDGVPFVSQEPVLSGESFTYEFIAGPSGTHMYHCHVDSQHHVDMGMYGLFIVEPRDADAQDVRFDREYGLMLDEWSKGHIHTTAQLGQGLDPTRTGNPLHSVDLAEQQARDTINRPPNPTVTDQSLATNPLQAQRDWYPVTFPPYEPVYDAFLINGAAFPLTKHLTISEGERLKVRIANIGALVHSMHLHGHSFLVTHKDGYMLPAPYRGDTLLIGPGERYDILIEGVNPGVWMFHDHAGAGATSDHVEPGGMMTMLVYEGFEDAAGHEHPTGASGNFLRWYERN